LFDALRDGRIGGVDVDPFRYRQSIRPLLLQSLDPAAGEIIAALDLKFRQ
jgi:hypothetical protein